MKIKSLVVVTIFDIWIFSVLQLQQWMLCFTINNWCSANNRGPRLDRCSPLSLIQPFKLTRKTSSPRITLKKGDIFIRPQGRGTSVHPEIFLALGRSESPGIEFCVPFSGWRMLVGYWIPPPLSYLSYVILQKSSVIYVWMICVPSLLFQTAGHKTRGFAWILTQGFGFRAG